MTTAIRETEWKYDAVPGTALPELTDVPRVERVSEPEEEQLEAVYHDTDDLRLARAGITLRRRTGGHDAGWHLKLPERPGVRTELHLPLDGTLPDEFARLVRARTRGKPLLPVARLATVRVRRLLYGPAGEPLAEVVLDEVRAQTLGATTTLTRWSELEVELTGGDKRLLRDVDRLLHRAGLRRSDHAAKLERALGDQWPAQALNGRRKSLTKRSTAGDVLLAYLREQTEALLTWDVMVRLDQPDAVHQLRVSARRLRGALQAFGRLLRPEQTRALIDELRWLGSVAGTARDDEVLREQLLAELAGLPVEQAIGPLQSRITGHYAPHEAAARTELVRALDSGRYLTLLDALARLLDEPPFTPRADRRATDVLPPLVGRAFRRVRRRMRRALDAPAGADRDVRLHDARKAAKRARYAAEAVRPAAGKPARRTAKRLKRLQSTLGAHQDAVLAAAAARELGVRAHHDGENAYTYGLLHERARADAAARRDDAARAWRRAARGGRTAWLHR